MSKLLGVNYVKETPKLVLMLQQYRMEVLQYRPCITTPIHSSVSRANGVGAPDDLAVNLRVLPRHVPQQLHANYLGVLSAGEAASCLRAAHGQQGSLCCAYWTYYW